MVAERMQTVLKTMEWYDIVAPHLLNDCGRPHVHNKKNKQTGIDALWPSPSSSSFCWPIKIMLSFIAVWHVFGLSISLIWPASWMYCCCCCYCLVWWKNRVTPHQSRFVGYLSSSIRVCICLANVSVCSNVFVLPWIRLRCRGPGTSL